VGEKAGKETGCCGRIASVVVIVVTIVAIIVVLTAIVVAVIATGVREWCVGVGRRCPASGEAVDVDAGCRCGSRRRGSCGLSDAHRSGELEEFFFDSATVFLKCAFGCCGCCLPSCSILHSPSSGRV